MNFANILLVFCILCSIFLVIVIVLGIVLVRRNPLLRLIFEDLILAKINKEFRKLKIFKKFNFKKHINPQKTKTKNKVVDKIIDAEFREVITEK